MTNTAITDQKRLTIGNVEIDAFKLPDGSYRIGIRQIAEMLDMSSSALLKSLQIQAKQTLDSQELGQGILEEVVVDTSSENAKQKKMWTITPQGLVVLLQWQFVQGNPKILPFLKDLMTLSINRYLDVALSKPPETSDIHNPVWQAYLDSEREREGVYRRLASS
jgi:hypothetical protein